MSELINRWRSVCSGIREVAQECKRDPATVQLVAVSKKHTLESIEALYHQGQRDFGENYVQELVTKAKGAQERGLSDIRWHFIGHLQRNKVKPLLPYVYRIHSIDSPALVDQVAKRWVELGKTTPLGVLLEVNLSGEVSKSGVTVSLLQDLVASVRSYPQQLDLKGLMCIPAADVELAEKAFQKLAQLAQELGLERKSLELSMGMSEDYPAAIRSGATWIRVGTAIFGPRPQQI